MQAPLQLTVRPRSIILILFCALVAAGQLAAQFSLDDLIFEPVATGLERPISIAHAGDGSGRLFIVLQAGRIVVHDGEQLVDELFLDISNQVSCCGEQGLLDVTFHPEFAVNGQFYVNYTDLDGNTIVSRFQVSPDPNVADPASEELVLKIEQPAASHNGGQLKFGPDGYLYIATGDGGGDKDDPDRAQDILSLLGKILRIDVDGEAPYSIPPDNPFAEIDSALSEIWVYGLRNPWRFSFDRTTGDMFIGDVGQAAREEIDFQPAGSGGGENYGWRLMEGNACFDPETGRPFPDDVPAETCNDGSLIAPIIEYAHREGSCGGSVTAGYVYRGEDYPELDGAYFYADFCTGRIWTAVQGEKASNQRALWTPVGPRETSFSISTFGEDEQGRLYVADLLSKTVFLIKADRPVPVLSRLTPFRHVAGGGDFEMTASGAGFIPATELWWNGEPQPTVVVDNTRLQAVIGKADVAAAGTAEIAIFTPPPRGGLSEPIEFVVVAATDLQPTLFEGGAVSAATYASGEPLSPGQIMAVFGIDVSAWAEVATLRPLPTALGGAVLVFKGKNGAALTSPKGQQFEGEVRVPAYFASPGQINALVPWELADTEEATLTVQVGPAVSDPIDVTLTSHTPGFFTLGDAGQAAVVISGTGGIVPAAIGSIPGVVSRPVRRSEFISIWCTGLGPVTDPPGTGQPTGVPPPLTTTLPVITIGGVEATVTFSGLSPGFVGLYQINVRVPEGAPSGDAVVMILTIGGVASNEVTIAIE